MSETEPRPNVGRRSGRDERRAQLLGAARQVFGSKGYHAATTDDITKAAGVAKGTFYLYFTEKREIFYALTQQFFDLVTEVGLAVSRDVRTRDEYFARLEAAASSLARLFRDNRDLVRLTYRESMSMDEKLEATAREFYRRIAHVEADNVRLGVQLGIFREDIHPLIAAYAHIGMVERVLQQWLFDKTFPAEPHLARQLVELACSGLRQVAGGETACVR